MFSHTHTAVLYNVLLQSFMMKNTTLSNQQRHQICLKKQNNQRLTQKELIKWCEHEIGIKVNQATISRTLDRPG